MSYRKLALEQGTDEWKAVRLTHLTASQAPVLFSLSPYQSRLELFEEKVLGREMEIDAFKADLFARGHAFEASARAWIKENLGIDFQPAVLESVEHPVLLASLDGLEESSETQILEAKFMGAQALEDVKRGVFKPHHVCQIQAQLLVSGAKRCIYFANDMHGNAAFAEIRPDRKFQDQVIALAEAFMRDVREGNAPEATDRDTFCPENNAIFDALRAAKREFDAAEARFEGIKKMVTKEYEKHRRVRCGDVLITRSVRKGAVAYTKIPELKAVDLDQYRGKATEVVSVKIGSNK